MRIKSIEVEKLFGIFDHAIDMKLDDRITIIHGPNGFGKTVLLRMIDSLFKGRHQELFTVPFKSLTIIFEDSSRLRATVQDGTADDPRGSLAQELIFELIKGKTKKKASVTSRARDRISFPLGGMERYVPGLRRIGPDSWMYLPTQEELHLSEVLERFGERFPIKAAKQTTENAEWLTELTSSLKVKYIEAQRLLRLPKGERSRSLSGEQGPMVPSVINYSQELAGEIQAKLAEYGTLSQSLDRTFPTRLVKLRKPPDLTADQLRNELSNLENKRSKLVEAGLLDKDEEMDFSVLQTIEEGNRNVLGVYVDDARTKLAVFDDLTQKIEIFKETLNSRFAYKEVVVGRKEGFSFKTFEGKTLPPGRLSSGEQHELVLIYELLFKVTHDSLILIDEPELSLHVAWQQQFLKDLSAITKLSEIDVLIATHSPQIIHDRWDLTVELKGPKDTRVVNA